MSEAPERVWLHNFDLKQLGEFVTNVFDADIYSEKHDDCAEFVRSDIAEAEKKAAVREALRQIKSVLQHPFDVWDDLSCSEELEPAENTIDRAIDVINITDQLLNEATQ